ncbi:hypothetical protein HY409_02525 [Candidatus Gottesmanbacteria bacterium]|nr:hypothetical protein [Candidatus Gottesmanbacteria bacterium]
MKKIIGIVVAVLVVGGILFTVKSTSSPTYTRETQPPQVASQTDRYIPYSETAFDAAADKRRVLYFHAPWCPTCRPLDKALSDNPNQIPEGVVILKTDYDSETALKTRYGVTYQHTFVEVDKVGNALQTWNGGDVNDIINRLKTKQ